MSLISIRTLGIQSASPHGSRLMLTNHATSLPPDAAEHWWPTENHSSSTDPSHPLPVWFSAFLVVAYCSIFWIGVGTLCRWIVGA